MSRPDEGLIHQWLDGECTPEESARIERLVASDPVWAAAVAEARGLIAASSRIVGALDAVPRAMPGDLAAAARPADEVSTRRVPPRDGAFRVPTWMRVAAGVVLVAGTAYVLRERSTEPFGIVTTPAPEMPAMLDTALGVQIGTASERVPPPSDVPPVGVARPAASAAEPASPPVALTPMVTAPAAAPPAPSPRADDLEAARAAEKRAEQRMEQDRARATRAASVAGAAPRSAPVPTAATPAAQAPMAPPVVMPVLDGCWRVSAPPELVGVLVMPPIRRAFGDTLVLVTTSGDLTVVRSGDVLRGAMEAKQEPCRSP